MTRTIQDSSCSSLIGTVKAVYALLARRPNQYILYRVRPYESSQGLCERAHISSWPIHAQDQKTEFRKEFYKQCQPRTIELFDSLPGDRRPPLRPSKPVQIIGTEGCEANVQTQSTSSCLASPTRSTRTRAGHTRSRAAARIAGIKMVQGLRAINKMLEKSSALSIPQHQ